MKLRVPWLITVAVLATSSAPADAQSSVATPTVTWIASSVPQGSKINLIKIVATDSNGTQKFIATGACKVSGKNLITEKIGQCKLQLAVSETQKFSAVASVAIIDVKKKVELNVLAAASLGDAFVDLGSAFMSKFLHINVRFSFAGSATLVTQILQGAPVDIVAMADTANMEKLVVSGEINKSKVSTLVRNELAILVPRGNPLKILNLNDLVRSGLKIVLCDESQPCGKYATTILSKAKILITPVSREASASGVVSRVANGEADAGIAYLTDGLVTGDKVDAVRIAAALNLEASYPIGVATRPASKDLDAIAAFLAMTKSKVGREIFVRKGFVTP